MPETNLISQNLTSLSTQEQENKTHTEDSQNNVLHVKSKLPFGNDGHRQQNIRNPTIQSNRDLMVIKKKYLYLTKIDCSETARFVKKHGYVCYYCHRIFTKKNDSYRDNHFCEFPDY